MITKNRRDGFRSIETDPADNRDFDGFCIETPGYRIGDRSLKDGDNDEPKRSCGDMLASVKNRHVEENSLDAAAVGKGLSL
ncbi:MAG: hypothetical protein VR70_03975 [Rhodospirillaceae bacterium BRH_c57]|nr:MAG: hypothetical protein VR70_03975 [Rhodospirillaceae bacterium BRH_c57]